MAANRIPNQLLLRPPNSRSRPPCKPTGVKCMRPRPCRTPSGSEMPSPDAAPAFARSPKPCPSPKRPLLQGSRSRRRLPGPPTRTASCPAAASSPRVSGNVGYVLAWLACRLQIETGAISSSGISQDPVRKKLDPTQDLQCRPTLADRRH